MFNTIMQTEQTYNYKSSIANELIDELYEERAIHVTDKEINEWVCVSEQTLVYNYEMLYAFYDPVTFFPIIRVARIDQDNDFIVQTIGASDVVNLGNYKKLGIIFCKRMPQLPEKLWPKIYNS